MPSRKGGGKKGKHSGGLGRALQNKARRDKVALSSKSAGTGFGIADVRDSANQLRSITEVSSLEEFVAHAVATNQQFVAEKERNMVLLDLNGTIVSSGPKHDAGFVKPMRIPRRPKWTKETTKAELEANETQAFLEWRRSLAEMSEGDTDGLAVTPFEKNMEVWRQLWRVVERSDVLVQIVDGRHPLMFWCPDLEMYVKEVDPSKRTLLLINKSDFLTDEFRLEWGRYFTEQGVDFIFFSAKKEQEELEAMERAMNAVPAGATESRLEAALREGVGSEGMDPREAALGAAPPAVEAVELPRAPAAAPIPPTPPPPAAATPPPPAAATPPAPAAGAGAEPSAGAGADADDEDAELREKCRVLGREELVEHVILKYGAALGLGAETDMPAAAEGEIGDAPPPRPLVVGMVGYPNVGKSSTINALLGATAAAHGTKRVAVGATPGKTKHFQTLALTPQVTLCDCPGLVFPSFVSTAAEMVVNGVLPIAHLRDHKPSMALVASRIPRVVFAETYGLKALEATDAAFLPASTVLDVYCHARGLMAAVHSGPDHSRGARILLRDYIAGRLLYCTPPPHAPDLRVTPAPATPVTLAVDHELGETRGGRRGSRLVHTNVLAGADAPDGLLGPAIPLPVAKHRSEKASVRNSQRRRRKGERHPDPYGCHTVSAMEDVVATELRARAKTKAKAKQVGRGREDAPFTRVSRPYP